MLSKGFPVSGYPGLKFTFSCQKSFWAKKNICEIKKVFKFVLVHGNKSTKLLIKVFSKFY